MRDESAEILPRDRQTQSTVHGAANHVGIIVILAIVLPPANRAQGLRVGLVEGQEPTTKAARSGGVGHNT
jgi:hypothetical protein